MKPKALISVSDKCGIDVFARFLVAHGWEILSTGGTAAHLEACGVPYTQVSDYTGFPEMLDGRLKTLQPRIHGGILARRDLPEHRAACLRHNMAPIDWVIVNLYPFAETIRKPNCSLEEAIENIDIGGPTLLRAAAKNFRDVIVCMDPADYEPLMREFADADKISEKTRFALARKVFSHTALYDSLIQGYLSDQEGLDAILRPAYILALEKRQDLRYGENPHQRAVYTAPSGVLDLPWRQIQGKELSYNNFLDMSAAYEWVAEFAGETACVIVKHTNPCGVGVSNTLPEAFARAKACDPVSAFGGIVAVTRELDGTSAKALEEMFLEVIVAPAFSPEALSLLGRKKNLRLIQINTTDRAAPALNIDIRRVLGGFLIQEADRILKPTSQWQWVGATKASPAREAALALAWKVVKHVKSNAIVLANEHGTLGIGAGQMSRIDSVRLAGEKATRAGLSLQGAVLASDAFFPFRDNIDEAAKLGVKAIVEPGGSVRDAEVIAACDEHGIALAFTGERHFKH
jgi:phosphoribosylaminoimidazolecarboxamide formyltransferase/IMP cyclohydrolase